MSTSTVYDNRNLDLFLFQGVDFTKNGTSKVNLGFGSPSRYIAGPQKAMQQFVISLFTYLGSQPNFPTFGTSLLVPAGSTNNQTQSYYYHLFHVSVYKVLDELRSWYQSHDVPDDEKVAEASLEQLTVNKDNLNLGIKIRFQAGDDFTLLIPLPL